MLKDSQGERREADQLFSQLRELAYQFDASEIDDYVVDMYAARRNVAFGDLEAAREWAKVRITPESFSDSESKEVGDILRSRLRKYENTIVARLFIAQGQYEDAIKLLDQSLAEARQADRVYLMIDADILRGIAFQANHNNIESVAAISNALTLAEPGGFMRVFLDHGDTVKELLEYAHGEIEDPKILSYIARLLNAYTSKIDQKQPITTPQKGKSLNH